MRRWIVFSLFAALPAACLSPFSAGTGTGGSGGTGQGSTTSGASSSGATTGTGGKSGASSSASSSGFSSSSVVSSSSGSTSLCPNEGGAYTITTNGMGCATEGIDTNAIVCIKQQGCDLTIGTSPSSSGPGVSGDTSIGPLGDFTGADITQGTAPRSGCIGAWDKTKSQLTITCGSVGVNCDAANTQCCSITLTPHNGGC